MAILDAMTKAFLTDMGKVHDLGGSSGGEGTIENVWADLQSVLWVGEQASKDIEFLDPLAAFQGPSSLTSLLIT